MWIDWQTVLQGVDVWLNALKREYEAPDLWRELHEGRLPVLKQEVDQDSRFTEEEVRKAEKSLAELGHRVRKECSRLGLSKEEADRIAGEFEGLKAILRTSSKRQFAHLIVGIVVNVSLLVAYDPDRTRRLLTLAADAFQWLFDFARLLPP